MAYRHSVIGPRCQRNPPELFIVQFEGVARLLHLPNGMVFSCAPASRITAMYPSGHRGCGSGSATPGRAV